MHIIIGNNCVPFEGQLLLNIKCDSASNVR
jgi:hypothetical protein